MEHIYAIENTIWEACRIVRKNAEGELSEAEIKIQVSRVIERAIVVTIMKMSQDVMEKAITQYGIGRALSDYRGDNVPDVEDLYSVVLKREIIFRIKEDERRESEGIIMEFYNNGYLMEDE